MQANSVSPAISAVSTQANNVLVQARTRQSEQDLQSQQTQTSRQSEQLQQARQAQRTQETSETSRAEQVRNETRQAPPTVNADGQTVGTRVNTTA